MKALTLISGAAISLGILAIALLSHPTVDPFALQKSSGYVLLVLGLITLALSLFNTRRRKVMALLVSGMVLVSIGERLPQIIFQAVFGRGKLADFRDVGLLFLFLGVVCVAGSWIILAAAAKSEDED